MPEVKSSGTHRSGRDGHSAALGSYMEYSERWLAALWPLIPLALAAAFLTYEAAVASANQICGVKLGISSCHSATAAENRAGTALVAVILTAIGMLYLSRRVLHRPWVRVGELGLEDRSQLFGIVHVGWQDVLAIPGSSPRPITRSVDLRIRPNTGLNAPRGWVRIRTGGMSVTSDEIEDQMDNAYRRFHGLAARSHQARLAPNKRVLAGIEVQTTKDTWYEVTQADLHHLIERNGLDDYLVVVSPARGPDHFIQARHTGSDVWDVEYRDGGPDHHFTASCMTNTEVFDAFVAWIRQNGNLTHLLDWRQLDGVDL